jgi:hypothetical protein
LTAKSAATAEPEARATQANDATISLFMTFTPDCRSN